MERRVMGGTEGECKRRRVHQEWMGRGNGRSLPADARPLGVMWPGVPAVFEGPPLSGSQLTGSILMSPFDWVAAGDEKVLPLTQENHFTVSCHQ